MTLSTTITIINEVDARVSGLRPEHTSSLYKKLAPFVPGYKFTPPFIMGSWDGRIPYFKQDGKTYTFLLDRVIPELVKWGYDVTIDDRRTEVDAWPELIDKDVFSHILHPETGKPIELRWYQVEMVNKMIENGHGIGLACTSAGKTLMCAALSYQFDKIGKRTLIVVPDGTLVRQTKRDYELVGLDVGELSGTVKQIDRPHLISTWQSLKNIPHIIKTFDVIVIDEAHKSKSKILSSLLLDQAAHMPFRYGVTGTLPEHEVDRMSVYAALGPVIYTIAADQLIEEGVLSDLEIEVVVLDDDVAQPYKIYQKDCDDRGLKPMTLANFKKNFMPDYNAEKNFLMNNATRNEAIAKRIIQNTKANGNTLVLVNSVSVARKLGQLIPGSYVVNGKDMKKVEDRQVIYDMFKEAEDLIVIATAHVASTGLSITRIFNVFFVDLGKSFTRVIQSIGRGLRRGGDKTFIHIVDIGGSLKYAVDHRQKRIKFYKEAKYPHFIIERTNETLTKEDPEYVNF